MTLRNMRDRGFRCVPADASFSCDATVPAAGTATATDNCSGATVAYNGQTTTPGNCAGNYTITRSWTATDGCGNSSAASQTITVTDNTAPGFTFVPADASFSCDATVPAAGTATATDHCSGATVAYNGQTTTPGNCAGNYTITRSWTATDGCGNSSAASQTITVTDNTAPGFTFVPADASFSCDATVPAAGTATATDNCSGATVAYNGQTTTPGNCAGNYTITRSWTATDGCGNSSAASQTITVTDNTAPGFTFVPAAAS